LSIEAAVVGIVDRVDVDENLIEDSPRQIKSGK
jgi:hypothetical protein